MDLKGREEKQSTPSLLPILLQIYLCSSIKWRPVVLFVIEPHNLCFLWEMETERPNNRTSLRASAAPRVEAENIHDNRERLECILTDITLKLQSKKQCKVLNKSLVVWPGEKTICQWMLPGLGISWSYEIPEDNSTVIFSKQWGEMEGISSSQLTTLLLLSVEIEK